MIVSILHSWRGLALFAALAAAAALAGALISQYAFGLRPCDLCILQRYPYAAILLLAALLAWVGGRKPALAQGLAALLILLFVVDAGIALYHVGVEQDWIAGPSACSGDNTATTLEALRAQIAGAALVSCKDTTFEFLGLSMAAWNAAYALASATVAAWLWRRARRPRA